MPQAARHSHNSYVLHIKQIAYLDDSNDYVGNCVGLCVIYIGANEWFEHLLWVRRLM